MTKTLKVLAVLVTIGMFLVLLMGAVVTKTGSADGCGNSWPLCYGKLLPDADRVDSLIEFSHRLVTGVEGILLLIVCVWAMKMFRNAKDVRFFALFSLFFTVVQAILGAMAVVWEQSDAVLALHFGISLLAFAGVLLLTIRIFQLAGDHAPDTTPVSPGFKYAIWLLMAYTYIVVYLGAYVRHTGSMLGCRDWPLCNGQLIPPVEGAAGIQFIHRAAAAVLFILTIWLFVYVYKHFSRSSSYFTGALWALMLLSFMVLSGGLVVLTQLNLFMMLMHTTLIMVYFGVISYLAYLSVKAPQAAARMESITESKP